MRCAAAGQPKKFDIRITDLKVQSYVRMVENAKISGVNWTPIRSASRCASSTRIGAMACYSGLHFDCWQKTLAQYTGAALCYGTATSRIAKQARQATTILMKSRVQEEEVGFGVGANPFSLAAMTVFMARGVRMWWYPDLVLAVGQSIGAWLWPVS